MKCNHCKDAIKQDFTTCGNCYNVFYCNARCGNKAIHDGHNDVCGEEPGMWSKNSVRGLVDDISSEHLQDRVQDFLGSNASTLDVGLRKKVLNELHINGGVFRAYIRPFLLTKSGRKKIIKRILEGEGRHYSTKEIDDILKVVAVKSWFSKKGEDKKNIYDPDGDILEAIQEVRDRR